MRVRNSYYSFPLYFSDTFLDYFFYIVSNSPPLAIQLLNLYHLLTKDDLIHQVKFLKGANNLSVVFDDNHKRILITAPKLTRHS